MWHFLSLRKRFKDFVHFFSLEIYKYSGRWSNNLNDAANNITKICKKRSIFF